MFHHTYVFPITESSQVGEARRFAGNACSILNFKDTRKGRVAIIINELANNILHHTPGGCLLLRAVETTSQSGIEILAVDRGPGLDMDVVLEDGYTTSSTPGTGLGAVRRQADRFDLYSNAGKGLAVVAQVFASDAEAGTLPAYEVGAVSVPMRGETVCGDAWSVHQEEDRLRVLVADGLGHGPHANEAAVEAVVEFRQQATAWSLDQLLERIHGRLKSTRGAALFLLTIKSPTEIVSCGVGNIRVVIQNPERRKILISHNGTAGMQIRSSRTEVNEWNSEGFIILHSDGITSRWDASKYPGIFSRHPSLLAAIIHRDFDRGSDDSTIVVIKRRS